MTALRISVVLSSAYAVKTKTLSTRKEGLDANTDPGLTERREKCCCLTSSLIG
jgi:hypothetical protein